MTVECNIAEKSGSCSSKCIWGTEGVYHDDYVVCILYE